MHRADVQRQRLPSWFEDEVGPPDLSHPDGGVDGGAVRPGSDQIARVDSAQIREITLREYIANGGQGVTTYESSADPNCSESERSTCKHVHASM